MTTNLQDLTFEVIYTFPRPELSAKSTLDSISSSNSNKFL